MTRINNLGMTTTEVVQELSKDDNGGYNPGAMDVCIRILGEGPEIDPDCPIPFLTLLRLDSLGIYAENIWILFKDVCHENMTNLFGLLRANQLGYLAGSNLKEAVTGHIELDVDEYVIRVKEFLPNFGKEGPTI